MLGGLGVDTRATFRRLKAGCVQTVREEAHTREVLLRDEVRDDILIC